MIRMMTRTDIEQISHIHETSWSPSELSVKLGKSYLRMFYGHIVESPHAFGFVCVADGKIAGYATGFYDYHEFNSSLKQINFFRLLMLIMAKTLMFKLKPTDIINLFSDDKKLVKAKYPNYHLGALALSNDFKGTPTGKTAITSTINAVLNHLAEKGFPGCWGLCDFENMPMRKYLLKLGFDEIDTIAMISKKVVLYEKTFNTNADQGEVFFNFLEK